MTGNASAPTLHRQRHGGQLHGDRDEQLRLGLVLADQQRRRDPGDDHAAVDRAASRRRSNSHYAQPLSVQVLDAGGNPVSGVTVTFALGSAAGGGGSAASAAGASFAGGSAQATATTNSDGIATSPQFTANATIGPFTATATVANVAEPASFALENLPGKGAQLTAVGSANRAATVEQRYSHSLRVLLRAANGTAGGRRHVTFTLGARRRRAPARAPAPASPAARARRPRRPALQRHRNLAVDHRRQRRGHLHRDRDHRVDNQQRPLHAPQPRRQAGHDHRRHRRRRGDPDGDALRDRARRHRHRRARKQGRPARS